MKKKIIEAKNLYKIYKVGDAEIQAVKDVSLDIFEGDFISIIGKSGSGKSTLMHLLGLLDTPTSGQIVLNGINTSSMTDSQLARVRNEQIGFVFQAFNLLTRTTALDNVLLPLKYSKKPKKDWNKMATQMLEVVDLKERMHNKSNELSGGQKQRVAIARALVTEPSIIFADEPTGNLDSKTGAEIENLFRKLNEQGKTIVLVTHDEDLARISRKKVVVSDGSIVDIVESA